MTGEDSPQDSYYIPPTAGPEAKELKRPEKRSGEDWNGLAIIITGMIVLIAAFQLFLIIMQLINTWVADELVPFFSAAFDLVIIAGGIWLIRNFFRKN